MLEFYATTFSLIKLIFYIKNKRTSRLQHKLVDTMHPVDVWKMLSLEMYLLILRYLYGITEAVVQRCFVKKLVLKIS